MDGEMNPTLDQVRQVTMPIYQARIWMKLVGVLSIIYGILVAFSIIGIVIAWLPIWMGVLLFQAASRAEEAYVSGDLGTIVDSLGKIRLYFTITGIVTLIGLLFALVFFFMMFVGMAGGMMDRIEM